MPFIRRQGWTILPLAALTVLGLALQTRIDDGLRIQAAPSFAAPDNDLLAHRTYFAETYSDDYSERFDTFPIQHEQSTAGATMEPTESASCAPIGATVWFHLPADRTGTLVLDTDGSDFETVLAVHLWVGGFVPPEARAANLSEIACDTADGGRTSIELPITDGAWYLVQVGGMSGDTGNLRVNGRCIDCTVPNDDEYSPHNNEVNAYRPSLTWHQPTDGATRNPWELQPCGNIGATVWILLYADFEADIEIDTTGSDFDTVVAAYREAPELDVGFPGAPAGLQRRRDWQASQTKDTHGRWPVSAPANRRQGRSERRTRTNAALLAVLSCA